MRLLLVLMAAVFLSGCAATVKTETSTNIGPVCTALGDPIRYNTYNEKSARHAGPALAPDLKRHNQVGRGLGCPAY